MTTAVKRKPVKPLAKVAKKVTTPAKARVKAKALHVSKDSDNCESEKQKYRFSKMQKELEASIREMKPRKEIKSTIAEEFISDYEPLVDTQVVRQPRSDEDDGLDKLYTNDEMKRIDKAIRRVLSERPKTDGDEKKAINGEFVCDIRRDTAKKMKEFEGIRTKALEHRAITSFNQMNILKGDIFKNQVVSYIVELNYSVPIAIYTAIYDMITLYEATKKDDPAQQKNMIYDLKNLHKIFHHIYSKQGEEYPLEEPPEKTVPVDMLKEKQITETNEHVKIGYTKEDLKEDDPELDALYSENARFEQYSHEHIPRYICNTPPAKVKVNKKVNVKANSDNFLPKVIKPSEEAIKQKKEVENFAQKSYDAIKSRERFESHLKEKLNDEQPHKGVIRIEDKKREEERKKIRPEQPKRTVTSFKLIDVFRPFYEDLADGSLKFKDIRKIQLAIRQDSVIAIYPNGTVEKIAPLREEAEWTRIARMLGDPSEYLQGIANN